MSTLKWIRDNIFGRKITPEKMMRQNQRVLARTIRKLDLERARMENQESRYIQDLKRLAKSGEMESVKIVARNLVQTRLFIKKFMLMKANLQAVEMKILTLRSQNAISDAMKNVTISMRAMNGSMKLPKIKAILQEFEKQSMVMGAKEEIVNDSIEENLGGDNEEEETDEIVTQIFEELGLELKDDLPDLPRARGGSLKGKTPVPCPTKYPTDNGLADANNENANEDDDADAQIRQRLANLRKNL